ncbi:MAG: winged helix-turn-helix domain-containing protein [Actinomycetales bacterium]
MTHEHDETQHPGPDQLPMRDLTDPQAMRALAHPRRIELLELLHVEGPMTASQCAARLGDSAASCSYHLRQLARFGFVEEAGDAPRSSGRDRPWQAMRSGLRFSSNRLSMSPAQRAAAELLDSVISDRRLAWLAQWQREVREMSPPATPTSSPSPNGAADGDGAAWVRASFASDFGFWTTPEELEEISQKLHDVLVPYQRRQFDDDASEARRQDACARFVSILLYGFPRSAPDA